MCKLVTKILDWGPYLGDRLISKNPEGYSIIIPEHIDEHIPLSCPICDCLLRSQEDEMAYVDFECCSFCAMKWAHPNRERWEKGWRPTSEQVVAIDRLPISVVFNID